MRRGLLAAIFVVLFASTGAWAGGAATTPRNVTDLLNAYGVSNTPADYVIVVDTSGSMMDPPALYPPVVAAYRRFVAAIGDHDQLSVITFDTAPDLRFSGDLSTAADRAAAAGALPPTATGARTDIGAALDAVLDQLQRPSANEVQTVVFLTDGQIDAPGSPYASTSSPAWKQLATRAAQVSGGHRLSVYGAGLGTKTTDIGALRNVFPATQIVGLPADQLPSFFAQAVQRARVERLYTPVSTELQEGFVSAAVRAGKLGPTTALTVTLHSTYPHLGARVIISGARVSGTGGPLQTELVGGPRTIDLGPLGTAEPIQLQVAVPDVHGGKAVGTERQMRQFTVQIAATVQAEPATVIGESLDIKASGRFVQADPITAQRTIGVPLWRLFVGLVLVLIALLLALWLYRRFLRTPPLPGGVLLETGTFERFRGSVTAMPNKDVAIPNTDGAVVEFFTKRGKFRKRIPRVYVRKLDGANRVQKYGVDRPLHSEEQLLPTDLVIVGRARLRVAPRGR